MESFFIFLSGSLISEIADSSSRELEIKIQPRRVVALGAYRDIYIKSPAALPATSHMHVRSMADTYQLQYASSMSAHTALC